MFPLPGFLPAWNPESLMLPAAGAAGLRGVFTSGGIAGAISPVRSRAGLSHTACREPMVRGWRA